MTAETRVGQQTGVETEAEKKPKTLGVVLVIIDASSVADGNPRIWTVNELCPKPETDRIPGQVAIPAETRKRDEEEYSTVLGGLAEFTDSEEVVGYLRIHPDRYYVRSAFDLNGFNVDMAFVFYEGPSDIEITPMDREEVEPNGWMEVAELSRLNGEARSFAHASLNFMQKHRVIEEIAAERDKTVPLTSIMEGYSSLREFLEERDAKEDIPLH